MGVTGLVFSFILLIVYAIGARGYSDLPRLVKQGYILGPILFSGPFSILAIIYGRISFKENFAKIGFYLGVISLVLIVIIFIMLSFI